MPAARTSSCRALCLKRTTAINDGPEAEVGIEGVLKVGSQTLPGNQVSFRPLRNPARGIHVCMYEQGGRVAGQRSGSRCEKSKCFNCPVHALFLPPSSWCGRGRLLPLALDLLLLCESLHASPDLVALGVHRGGHCSGRRSRTTRTQTAFEKFWRSRRPLGPRDTTPAWRCGSLCGPRYPEGSGESAEGHLVSDVVV